MESALEGRNPCRKASGWATRARGSHPCMVQRSDSKPDRGREGGDSLGDRFEDGGEERGSVVVGDQDVHQATVQEFERAGVARQRVASDQIRRPGGDQHSDAPDLFGRGEVDRKLGDAAADLVHNVHPLWRIVVVGGQDQAAAIPFRRHPSEDLKRQFIRLGGVADAAVDLGLDLRHRLGIECAGAEF